ncbi:hypothetical protein ANN_14801 [Periplaneta americana]|uniref:Carboxylesterase type B domain-containing protein n=1 Tax=Periplaneta americana TaxID=6978 RepID=A0ABQ8SXX2_PERAM|nr:hypothetical protein ANN_14801 [Periplaneta americana]
MPMLRILPTKKIVSDALAVMFQLPGESNGFLHAVMVWIHGGGFSIGDGNSWIYGPDYLVAEGVVLVTINYRLGPLGFLSTGDSVIPGNNGLKDQVMALRWVQQNVAQFGGDPGNVTIFGSSSGGSCVHFHMLSAMSEGLFHHAISQSGSAMNSWAMDEDPQRLAFHLGEVLGCRTNDSVILAEFLRATPIRRIMEALDKVKQKEVQFRGKCLFTPVIERGRVEGEEAFLEESPVDLMNQGRFHKVPLITGITSHEGLIMLKEILMNPQQLELYNKNFEQLVRRILRIVKVNDNQLKIAARKIKQFYFGDRPLCQDTLLDSLPSKETLRGHSDSSFRGEGYIQCCVGVRLCDMYSNQELAEIHFMYGKADGNAALARRLYQERYPQRQCPDRKTFVRRGGPITWPPRSPDLNPLDFYLWGHLKSLVYSSPVPDLESLRNRIVACSEDIRNTPGVWDRVRRSMRHRCELNTDVLFVFPIYMHLKRHLLHSTFPVYCYRFSFDGKLAYLKNLLALTQYPDKNSIKHTTMRVLLFQTIAPGIPLPPQPILTRWKTWLDAVNYYAEYYGKIMEVIDALDSTDSSAFAAIKSLPSEQLLEDILFIDSNFKIVSKSITLLESQCKQLAVSFAGVCHADEIGYLFRVGHMDHDLDPTSPEVKTRTRLVKMWTNFAKTGCPTPKKDWLVNVIWRPTEYEERWYLNIDTELSIQQHLNKERICFWEDIFRSLEE